MSNNKQNSVEWLFEEQFNSFEKFNNGEFSFSEYMAHNLTLREQAKAMHKEEVLGFKDLVDNHQIDALENNTIYLTDEELYNEIFGGNK